MHPKSIIYTLLLLLIALHINAKELKYQVSNIDPKLKVKADAIIRNHDIVKTINPNGTITIHEVYAVTIFNKNAQTLGYYNEYFDTHSAVSNHTLNIYDANGNLIQKSKSSDFNHRPLYENGFHSDGVIVYNNAFCTKYPYTVEIIHKYTDRQTLAIGHWQPCPGSRVAIQNATLTIKTNDTTSFRYKSVNMPTTCSVTTQKNTHVYTWQLTNFYAIDNEPFMPYYQQIYPHVLLGATNFICEGTNGNMQTWQNFGLWSYSLIKEQNVLPQKTIDKIKELCSNAKTEREKIEIIYKYMQRKTRYVSIQEGIGGWKPFAAELVDQLNYGDCKALSNYTKALLEVEGIEAIYTRIYAGYDYKGMVTDFPSQQFNHIILCVPNHGDTIWLECTSQKQPFGYLGGFTQNRNCLLITQQGGKIAHTPYYNHKANSRSTTINAQIVNQNTLNFNTTITNRALKYDYYEQMLSIRSDKQKEFLYEDFDIPGLNIDNFKTLQTIDTLPQITLNITGNIEKYATTSNNRLMFALNILHRSNYIPELNNKRNYNILIKNEYTHTDTVIIDIPEGYKIEYLPQPVTIKNQYCQYSSKAEVLDNKIIYTRFIERYKCCLDASEYNNVRNFYKLLANADNEKTVLIKL